MCYYFSLYLTSVSGAGGASNILSHDSLSWSWKKSGKISLLVIKGEVSPMVSCNLQVLHVSWIDTYRPWTNSQQCTLNYSETGLNWTLHKPKLILTDHEQIHNNAL